MAIDYENSSSSNLVGDPSEGGAFSSGNKQEISAANSASASATAAATTATDKAIQAQNSATTAQGHAVSAGNAIGTVNAALSTIQGIESSLSSALSDAQAAQAAAEAALDTFDDSYLGPKGSNPTANNDGDALTEGNLYYNTISKNLMVYDGTSWQTAAQSTTQVFLKSNNFSDVVDTAAARTNLGLGTMAEEASSDYAALAGATFTGTVESPEFSGALDGNVVFTAKAGEALSKGDVVYVSGISGQTPVVSKADANSTGKHPAFGVADSSVSNNQNLKVISQGQLKQIDTSAFSLGDTLYLSTTPGQLTNVPPAGEGVVIQNLGKVEREHASSGSILVSGAGRSATTPNLNNGNIFIGDSNNKAVTASLSSKVAEALAGQQVPGTGTFTGDLSAAGLNLSDADPRITLTDSDSNIIGQIYQSNYNLITTSASNNSSAYGGFVFLGINNSGLYKTRFIIDADGDIIFGNNSGTAKFLWDASNERLGIGNTTPAEALDVTGNIKASGEFIGNLSNATQQDITQLGTIGSLIATTADINGGTINQTTIDESDITVGSGKTLDVSSGTLTLADNQINPSKLSNGTINGSVTIDTTGSIETDSSVTASQFSVGSQYTLPSSDGSSDQVLITDGSGNVTFGDVPSSALTSHVATALNHANTASGHADSASASATSASGYATTATNKANEAAGYATTATNKANEAAASESTTAGYVSSASNSAQSAANYVQSAANSANTANTYASQANASAASAAASATDSSNAASAWSSFYNSYLGTYSSAPSVDVQGNPIVTGAFYYDTGAGSNTVGLYVYNGSSWVYSTNYNNVTAPYSLSQDLATNSNDINFGNNAKAQFGAGNDLQIYSDGTHSRIHESGSGLLVVRASNFNVNTADGSESYITMEDGGGVASFYNGSQKLKTTSTGIDVTGDINGTGDVIIESPNPYLDLKDTTNPSTFRIYNADSTVRYYADKNDEKSNSKHEFRVDGDKQVAVFRGGGDVYFYEDTGTTPKFFWDASAERLGIGTASPATALDISQSNTRGAYLRSSTTGSRMHFLDATTASITTVGIGAEGNNLVLHGGGAEFMRVASSGNVGIGTSSPSSKLTVVGDIEQTTGDLKYTGAINWDIAHHGAGQNIVFSTTPSGGSATQRMRIASNGNVGIGTSSPATKLAVHGGTSGTDVDVASFNSVSGALNIRCSDLAAANPTWTLRSFAGEPIAFAQATDERMRIDSSGKVGIGTSSPTNKLDVSGGNFGLDSGRSVFLGSDSKVYINSTSSSRVMRLYTDNTERMRIDSSGNVGIGTNNPSHKLDISGGHLRLDDAYRIRFGGGTAAIEGNSSSNILSLITNNTERMRIDSSGNLLVGTTDSSPVGNNDSDGIALLANGSGQFSRDGGTALLVNRKTSDGELLRFNKDSTSVGSIGTASGTLVVGSTNGSGSYLKFGSNVVAPVDTNGAVRDNAIDLGQTNARFKDLYLSGGAYLGGTTAANKLDDYEEGTFTLNTAGDSSGAFQDTPTCLYTKIGNTVNVFIAFRVGTNFTSQNVGGLPFTTSHTGMNSAFISGGIAITGSNNTISATVGNSGTSIRFHDNQNTSDAHLPNTTDEYYRLNFTYKTA